MLAGIRSNANQSKEADEEGNHRLKRIQEEDGEEGYYLNEEEEVERMGKARWTKKTRRRRRREFVKGRDSRRKGKMREWEMRNVNFRFGFLRFSRLNF